MVSWIHYLNLTRKLFSPLGVLKCGVEITITYINLTTGTKHMQIVGQLAYVVQALGKQNTNAIKNQMKAEILLIDQNLCLNHKVFIFLMLVV